MKNKFTAILITAAMCINGTSTVIADDKSDIMKDIDNDSLEEIHGRETLVVDANGDVYTTEKLATELGYSKDDIIERYWLKDKIYSKNGYNIEVQNSIVDILQDNDTIYDFISDNKKYCIWVKTGNKIVGLDLLSKGKPYEEAKKNIESRTDLSEELKKSLLENAKKLDGQWYISTSLIYDNNYKFLTISEIKEKLTEKGITDIEDIKYISGGQYVENAACIKTKNSEYIIPFCAWTDILKDIVNGEVYTIEEFKPLVINAEELMIQHMRNPTPTPKSTATPKPTAKPTETPEPTEKPTASPKPTATPSATAEPQPTAKPDCSSWAESDIENAVSKKILPQDMQSGYTKLIDRADFCRIAYNMLDISGKAENVNNGTHFDDISMKEIYMLSGMGIINGKGENKFAPNDNITREEAAAILSRMVSYLKLNLPEQNGASYSDDGEISDWAKENVYDVKKLGVMQGVDGNKFDPKSGYTKEQAIVTIMRVMKNIK